MAVQFHLRREPRKDMAEKAQVNKPSKCLFIGNMSFQMSDKDLNDLFRNITNVLDVRVAVDRRSGQPRGFCHADFIDVPSAQAAKEILETKEIYGRQLRVDFSRSSQPSSTDGETREPRERREPREHRERREPRERRED
jgi:nucleolin